MEVDKNKLQMMMREYWAIDNNDVCLNMTIIFLRDLGLSDKEIKNWLDYHSMVDGELPKITEDDKSTWADSMEQQMFYYSEDNK